MSSKGPFAQLKLTEEEWLAVYEALGQYVENIETSDEALEEATVRRGNLAAALVDRMSARLAELAEVA